MTGHNGNRRTHNIYIEEAVQTNGHSTANLMLLTIQALTQNKNNRQ